MYSSPWQLSIFAFLGLQREITPTELSGSAQQFLWPLRGTPALTFIPKLPNMTAQILTCPRLSTHTHSQPSKLLLNPRTHPGQLLKSASGSWHHSSISLKKQNNPLPLPFHSWSPGELPVPAALWDQPGTLALQPNHSPFMALPMFSSVGALGETGTAWHRQSTCSEVNPPNSPAVLTVWAGNVKTSWSRFSFRDFRYWFCIRSTQQNNNNNKIGDHFCYRTSMACQPCT